MKRIRDAAFKVRVALQAVKGEKTIAQIASKYGIPSNQIRQWRARLLELLPELFSQRRAQQEKARDKLEGELYRQIGQFKVELEWLNKEPQSLLSS